MSLCLLVPWVLHDVSSNSLHLISIFMTWREIFLYITRVTWVRCIWNYILLVDSYIHVSPFSRFSLTHPLSLPWSHARWFDLFATSIYPMQRDRERKNETKMLLQWNHAIRWKFSTHLSVNQSTGTHWIYTIFIGWGISFVLAFFIVSISVHFTRFNCHTDAGKMFFLSCYFSKKRATSHFFASPSMTRATIAIVSFAHRDILCHAFSFLLSCIHLVLFTSNIRLSLEYSLAFRCSLYDSSLQFMHACTVTFSSLLSISKQMHPCALLHLTHCALNLSSSEHWQRWQWILYSLRERQFTVKVRSRAK